MSKEMAVPTAETDTELTVQDSRSDDEERCDERQPLVPPVPDSLTPAPAAFYLGSLLERDEDSCTFERVFDLDTDEYLTHHRVDSVPTLPGMFVTEIAFEAASYLVPQLSVFAFEDLRFHHFLKVQDGERAAAKKTTIRAWVVERDPDLDQAVVAVEVTADVVASNGIVLAEDKPYFEARVLLAARLPEAPVWEPWSPAVEILVPDPYHRPGSPVLLTGMFESTTDTRLHPNGKRASYDLRLPNGHPAFSRFCLPAILMDGLARTGVLTNGDLMPLAAPLAISRIDVYEHGGDYQVGERYGGIDLYAMQPGAKAVGRCPGGGSRFVAVRPDGRILLQMKGLHWIILGYLNRDSGQSVTPEKAATMGKAEAGAGPGPAPANPDRGQTPVAPVVRMADFTATRADRATGPSGSQAPARARRPEGQAKKRPPRTAPGPNGIGFVPLNLRAFQREAPELFLSMRGIYGDMVRLRLGYFTVHLNYHPDAIRYVLRDNNQNYVRGKGYDAFKTFMGNGLLTLDEPEWCQYRRIVNPLLHKSAIEAIATTMTSVITAVLDRWERQVHPCGSIDVVTEMIGLTLDVLGKAVLDTDLGPINAQAGPAMVTAIEAMVFRGALPQLTPSATPIPYSQRIKQAHSMMNDAVDRIVEAHRAGRHNGTSDLVNLLLSATREDGTPWTKQQIRDEIMTVFMAGHETTGTGLAWALYELAGNPGVQERLNEEAERELSGRTPGLGDLRRLRYTQMVIHETLRLHPPIWVYPRDAVEEDEIAGWRIPAKGSVFMVPYVTHRHPDFWVDPERFDPERFSPQNTAGRARYTYFPFGGGQCKCTGNQMALLQMQLTLAMIAQRFRLRAVPERPVTLGTQVSFRPLDGIRLSLEPRSR